LGAFRPRPGQLSGDLMSYRSEIEKITPSHHRKKKLWQILKNEHIPPSIITAEENAENGKWELIKKEETRKRKKIVWATLRKCSTQHLYDKLSKHLW
ncbi:MAG: hypothetical protein NWF06_10395, partial [Candidatus Bathyarchaeota archaeon]|nr:hypothetical protein [Candidatus Bathyarchaeum sp.]